MNSNDVILNMDRSPFVESDPINSKPQETVEISEVKMGGMRVVDGELYKVCDQIHSELNRPNPDWEKIGQYVQDFARLLCRKAGINDLEQIQSLIEEMLREVKRVADTYNSKWELTLAIASGTLGIVAGVVGVGAGLSGFSALLKGAEEVPKLVQTVSSVSQTAGQIGSGLTQGISGPIKSHEEKNRTVYQFDLQRSGERKDVFRQSSQQEKAAYREALQAMGAAALAAHRSRMNVLGAAAAA